MVAAAQADGHADAAVIVIGRHEDAELALLEGTLL
jgi:hypothetical protein